MINQVYDQRMILHTQSDSGTRTKKETAIQTEFEY